MYPLYLTDSLIAPQGDEVAREVTVGDVLREVAASHPGAGAMTEVNLEGEHRPHLDLPRAVGRQ